MRCANDTQQFTMFSERMMIMTKDANKRELPELMSVKELREYLHVSTQYAYELVKLRNFPSIRLGNKYYVNKDRLANWLERQELVK